MSHHRKVRGSSQDVKLSSEHDLSLVLFTISIGGRVTLLGKIDFKAVMVSSNRHVGIMGKHRGETPMLYHRITNGTATKNSMASPGKPM